MKAFRLIPPITAIAILAVAASAWAAPSGSSPTDDRIPNHYIVVLKDSVDHPGAVAEAQTEQHDGDLGFVYRLGIKGYSAKLSKSAVEALRNNPTVRYVTADREGELLSQTTPTGVARVFAPQIPTLDIDEVDDVRVNADVTVIDTGIDYTHPDLNVAGRTDCGIAESCVDEHGIDEFGHGTHVAGIIGAIDNGFGVVGVAPGARIWAARVDGSISDSSAIHAIEWVTAHASQIEVVNMSLGWKGHITVMEEAIEASVEAGVVYVVAAGNQDQNAENVSPASFSNVITVSALSDYDGLPGGLNENCRHGFSDLGPDDHLASYSNWGPAVDIAAPGSCIYSTWPNGEYRKDTGTSMASPTGAAAILASESNPNSKADVEAIKAKLITEGSLNWVDDSGDGKKEPLLDLRAPAREAVTLSASGLQTHSANLNGVANAGGSAATYSFEYGTSAEYGQSAPATPQSIGSGTGDVEALQQIPVEPNTAYHYRLVVTNSAGTSYGEDRTFTTSSWSIQPTPVPSGTVDPTKLKDVSCPSKTECFGVGLSTAEEGGSFSRVPLAERWDGKDWAVQTVPKPETGTSPVLEAVSCVSSASCMAVGLVKISNFTRPFAERWDGSSWSTVAMPTPSDIAAKSDLKLSDVSCLSSSSCVAVGSYVNSVAKKRDSSRRKDPGRDLERHRMDDPVPPNPKAFNTLSGVSCSASNACTAVGNTRSTFFAEGEVSLAERWDGSAWTVQTTPNPAGADETIFEEVSCPSASFCMAVGNSYGGGGFQEIPQEGLSASWEGTEWKLRSSNLPSRLYGVSCASASACWAVGSTFNQPNFGQRWNGSEWLTESTASPEGASQLELMAVSCPSASACTAVGSYYAPRSSPTQGRVPLAERLTPSWSTQTTPNPTPKEENQLEDVSCSSSVKCLATGIDEYRNKGMLQAWNGSEWKIVNKDLDGRASALSCASAGSCMAVGYRTQGSEPRTWALSEQSAKSWFAIQKPLITPEGATILTVRDVSCASTTYCIAVGYYYAGGQYKSLAESWNGTAWSLQTVPNPPEGNGRDAMLSVSCASSTSCVAVGKAANKPVAQTWNGTTWSSAMAQNPAGANYASLEGISCTSTTSCRAVGYWLENGKQNRALAESWNGTSWTIQATPNPGEGEVSLRSISCTSTTSCTAVGSYVSKWQKTFLTEEERVTLVESWNGTEWAIQPSTNPEPFSLLSGVSCSASTACTAVGSSRPKAGAVGMVTLAERYE